MNERKRFVVPLPGGRALTLGARTLVMGILNVTPDSFADGGVRFDAGRAVDDGLRMTQEGADILDVGGESTRPGAEAVGKEEEMRRVLPVVAGLAGAGALVSIDTYKSEVAREAVARGAVIVNDVSGLQFDPGLGRAIAETGAAAILMHNRGRSDVMYRYADYADVPAEVTAELEAALKRAIAAGVPMESLILDPGVGFSKRPPHSYAVLAHLDRFASLGCPILTGPSRKSFLNDAIGERHPSEREWGTAAAVAASVLLGAHIVRVHGVRAMVDVVRVADALRNAAGSAVSSSAQ